MRISIFLFSFLIAGSSMGGMTIKGARWASNSVEVCFASRKQAGDSRFAEDSKTFPTLPAKVKLADPTAEEKGLIETIVRSEYNLAATGFEFTGFQNCVSGTKAKLFVYLGHGGPLGAGNIGEGMKIDKYWQYRDREGNVVLSPVYVKLSTALPSYVYFQNLKALRGQDSRLALAERLQMNVLHEFGHAVGLLHEDERAEANASPNCYYQNSQSATRTSEPIALTSYDFASVMSYCFLNSINNQTGLHYQIAQAGLDPTAIPKYGVPVVRWPGLNLDGEDRVLSRVPGTDRFDVKIRLGLSEKDRQSIRCLYAPMAGCPRG
jgi:hypothetical protein